MSIKEKQELGDALWKIANELRGAMNADDFRDYMLSFLFLRYLSDNYEAAAKKELGPDYPTPKEGERNSPLWLWYKANEPDIPEFEKQMRRKIHYVIEPKYLWSNIIELARRQQENLLETLSNGFKFIENESFERTFQGLFSEINLNSEKLGKTEKDRNEKLGIILLKIDQEIPGSSSDSDTLGDAYEYLLGKFAAGSGQKAGEFYTPQPISQILSEIVVLDSHDPTTGPKEKLERVLDLTCGSGSLLINVRKVLRKSDRGQIGKIYGQEKNVTTYNLARMNMLLHRVKDTEFEIFHGDTLTNEWDLFNEPNPAKKLEFDAVVANPPFSYRWQPGEEMAQDFRFKDYGLAPKSAADFAFLLHGFHFLKKDGCMAIILPHGVLFRGGVEERIRKKLILEGSIDTIIGLPANLFYSTGIPVCIVVLKKCKKPDDILFINASSSDNYQKDKKQNVLLQKHIDKIVQTYQFRTEEKGFSRRVALNEIESEGFNLNITRYVSPEKEEEEIDLKKVKKSLDEIELRIKSATEKHNQFLKELGLDLIF